MNEALKVCFTKILYNVMRKIISLHGRVFCRQDPASRSMGPCSRTHLSSSPFCSVAGTAPPPSLDTSANRGARRCRQSLTFSGSASSLSCLRWCLQSGTLPDQQFEFTRSLGLREANISRTLWGRFPRRGTECLAFS